MTETSNVLPESDGEAQVSGGMDVNLAALRAAATKVGPWEVALFVFPESVVLHASRELIGAECTDLGMALHFLGDCCFDYDVIRRAARPEGDACYVAFYVHASPLPAQAVAFRAMWDLETKWRQEPPAAGAFDGAEAGAFRSTVHRVAASILPVVTERSAIAELLPAGPYHTYLGPVVVRWNNTMCREACPFCGEVFRPSWGLWAFLEGLGGPVLCFDCWARGDRIAPLPDVDAIPAVPGHVHDLEPNDTQGHSGDCRSCGAYWTLRDGWFRMGADGLWRSEAAGATAKGGAGKVEDTLGYSFRLSLECATDCFEQIGAFVIGEFGEEADPDVCGAIVERFTLEEREALRELQAALQVKVSLDGEGFYSHRFVSLFEDDPTCCVLLFSRELRPGEIALLWERAQSFQEWYNRQERDGGGTVALRGYCYAREYVGYECLAGGHRPG